MPYRVMLLDDRRTWSRCLRNFLYENEPALRAYQQEEIRFLNDSHRDGRYIPAAERSPNMFFRRWERLLIAICDVIRDEHVLGFHCTRLTDAEMADIIANGMRLPCKGMLEARIARLQADGAINTTVAARLLSKHQAASPSRANRIWFIFTRGLLREESGVGDLFRHWGGEALYNLHDRDPVTGPILRAVGAARIITAVVPVAELGLTYVLAGIVARRFLAGRGVKLANGLGYSACVEQPILADQIPRVLSRGDSEFEALTGCDAWRRSLG
jgi:hypothetical protein